MAKDTTPATLENLQARRDRAAAAHTAELDAIEAEQKAAAELQMPLGRALQDWLDLHERILRAEGHLATFKANAVKYQELLDSVLDFPEADHGANLWRAMGANPALSNATESAIETSRYLEARRKQLVELEKKVAGLLNDGRKHLAHLLPDELKHLA